MHWKVFSTCSYATFGLICLRTGPSNPSIHSTVDDGLRGVIFLRSAHLICTRFLELKFDGFLHDLLRGFFELRKSFLAKIFICCAKNEWLKSTNTAKNQMFRVFGLKETKSLFSTLNSKFYSPKIFTFPWPYWTHSFIRPLSAF